MPIDEDTLDRVRQTLAESQRVDDRRIDVVADGEQVVLRGAIDSPEAADAAAMLAERHVDVVDNRLVVDSNLREGDVEARASRSEVEAPQPRERDEAPYDEVWVGSTDLDAGGHARDAEKQQEGHVEALGLSEGLDKGMSFGPGAMTEDLTVAMGENLPLDPPDEPHLGTTASEERGVSPRATSDEPIADAGPTEDPDTPPSAPDLSQEDLERSVRGGRAPSLDPDPETARPRPAPDGSDTGY